MNRGPRRIGNNGSMPFALVAVTILLISSTYCAVTASIKETEDGIENTEKELNNLADSAQSTESFVERGLGNILYGVCTESNAGTLSERGALFKERADQWMRFQFPLENSGITVRLVDYTMDVQSERFQIETDEWDTNGYVPSYLKAVGSVTAIYQSETGKCTRTFEFSTDGSCALPLTLEMGSLFENAITGEGTVLYQMVKYQLTSLAQYRVINGYGAMSQYGEKGTNSILTEKDVEEAYRKAINALECLYFRDDSGNEFEGSTDLAKDLVSKNGSVSINLSSVYAQALAAKIDDIVGKWFDYFLGNILLSICDQVSDNLKNAWNALTSFVTGKNNFSAAPYIREVIGDTYTGIRTGQTFTFIAEDPVTGNTREYTIDYPEVDLYGSGLIKNFKSNYNRDTNNVREWLYKVVNTAIAEIADGKGMNTVYISTNNSESFADTVSEGISLALCGKIKSFENAAIEAIRSDKIPDQFYSAIFDTISRNKDGLFTYSDESFNENIKRQISNHLEDDFFMEEHPHSENNAEEILAHSFEIDENRRIRQEYREEVDSLLQRLNNLNNVTGSGSSIIEKGCIAILEGDFLRIDCIVDIRNVAIAMSEEYVRNIEINPYSGYTELTDEDVFILKHEGLELYEKLSVTDLSSPVISVGKASEKSTHETGFKESEYAAYCTIFPVKIKDEFTFNVESAGTLLYALGMCDSAYCDTVTIDLEIDVPVVSGWGLVGAEYGASVTFLSDIFSIFLKALEPLLEPLRKIMEMAESVMDSISKAVRMIAQYYNDYLEYLYNTIMKPLEMISELFQENVSDVFCEQMISITEDASAIIDISLVGQTLGFTYMGFTVKFTFNIATLEKYTKNIVKAEFEGDVDGVYISAFINVKTKGENKKTVYVNGGFTLKGDDWDLEGTIDPKMAYGKHLVTIGGTVYGVQIDAVLPEAVQYNKIGFALSDVPGVSEALSNIPSPVPGTKLEVDAGIELKYSIPIETGVLINEFEPNPAGTDTNNEWAELLNLSGSTVDLNNWTLTTSKKKVHIIKDIKLSPGERTVIEFTGSFLVNSKEYLILKDPDGVEVDRSATMSDGGNDSKTCQRGMDGSTEWSLLEGTCGEANKGGIFGTDGILYSVIKDVVSKAVVKALNEMKHVYTEEAFCELMRRSIQYALDDGINRIASCLVEGTMYITLDFTDVSSSAHVGFKMYLMADSELVGDVLKYLVGQMESLFLGIDDPYNIDFDSILYDDVYFGMATYAAVKAPSMLCASKNYQEKVMVCYDIACNLTALASLFDTDLGTPKVRSQIGIKNCPYELIPKSMGMKKNMTYDYWFLKVTFKW